ncbi:hypothetical protein QTN47_00885 [Danxiaibacter flavus]|uniref:FtsX-like permease family protein n=1 Tax=Danxiaibacter flavus TaxID=3049108 RepID=A0ABV3ZAB1_9BACT|nr:hypothetical protein QNM32_00885 [Chitinophagaceae bacterium DXS]
MNLSLLLKKLIKTSAGRSRFILAILGLSVALFLILAAVQIQANYDDLLHNKTNQDSIANFLVINKVITSETIGQTALTENQISDVKKQPFVQALGVLTSSRFKVSAQGASNQLPFYTDLFFESVPDDFLDVNNKDWAWNDQSTFIPLIIPNSFLDMYNFGFASSQGLPKLSQDLVRNIPLQINIQSANGPVKYYAKVVGFSDRIASILVPQSFMDWANSKFGTEPPASPSRIVIRTKDPGNPELLNYLKEHGLTTDADKTRFSKYRQIVNIVVNISWITGAVMLLFALLIFTLFIQLTIASCKDEIALLITLGAAPKQLKTFLIKQFFPPNIIIVFVTLAIIALLQFWVKHWLSGEHIYVSGFISITTIISAALIMLVLWIVNFVTIKKYINKH